MNREVIYKFDGRLQGDYHVFFPKQISTSKNVIRGSTLTNFPQSSDINNGQKKRSVLDNNSKETCEKNNQKMLRLQKIQH